MNNPSSEEKEMQQKAERLFRMISRLTLFTRKTAYEWIVEVAAETGVTQEQFFIMFELNIAPDQSLSKLAETLSASPPNLSVSVQSLVELGWVSRRPDPEDRRRVLLQLSDEGQQQFLYATKHLEERYQTYLMGLSEKNQHDLDHAATLMLEVVERIL